VQVIDFAGPYEVLIGEERLFDVVTVGLTGGEFRAGSIERGLRMIPDYSIENCPELDILVLPGGEVGQVEDDPRAMKWVNETVARAECVMSVCNGAFILAEGGHLKNQRATTFHYFIDDLREAEPTCTPVYDERFVDNGKIITSAGLSSGIDAALHLIERYGSRYQARQRALGLEYNWQPEAGWSRGGLADRHYITMVGNGFDFPEGALQGWTTVQNDGDAERWTKRWTFESALERAELLRIFEAKLAASWTRSGAEGSSWSFRDEKGRAWKAELGLVPTGAGTWGASIDIARDAAAASEGAQR
jgi:putative intracellular protease/amidase